MGHIRLGALPRTLKWARVVELVERNGNAAEVAAAALIAAEQGLKEAATDAGLARSLWLLTQLPRNPRREQAVRVSLGVGPAGVTALPTGAQGSHILSSLLTADALGMIPMGEGVVATGDEITLRALAR